MSAFGQPANRQLSECFPAENVQPEIVFLGCVTRTTRRATAAKELERLNKSKAMLFLLSTLFLPTETFSPYSRLFGMSQVAYGWLARLPPISESRRLWKAVHRGHSANRVANEWSRAMVYGGLNHLDAISATNLVRICSILKALGASWNAPCGAPT